MVSYPYIVGLKYEKSAILPNCLPQIMKSILFESREKFEFQKTFIFCLWDNHVYVSDY